MESFLIYDTKNYELNDFNITIQLLNNKKIVFERKIFPDRIIIWKVTDLNVIVDMYSLSQTISNDIKVINNFINTNKVDDVIVSVYPSQEQEDIYISIYPSDLNFIAEKSREIPKSHAFMGQIEGIAKVDIKYLNNTFENIDDSFENVTKTEAEITKEERDFIAKVNEMQNSQSWYKDQVRKKKKTSNTDFSFLKPSNLFKAASSSKNEPTPAVTETVNDKIFDKSALRIEPGSQDPMGDLQNIIGLENVKHEIEKLESTLEYKKERSSRGIKDETSNSLHMCFYGSPGTGKTTVARIMTGLLYKMGYIAENKCVEINGLDFKGGYVGQTEIITKGILDTSQGGVLFVDEAYALCNGPNDSYGKEAINTFIKEMEDNRDKLIIIFAGYEKDMDEFLDQNTGFKSRINRYFKFENYSIIELSEILINNLRRKHLKITDECLEKCMIAFKKAKKYHKFGNGRFVGNLIEKIEEQHMLNVMGMMQFNPKTKFIDPEIEKRQDTFTIEDFPDSVIDELLKSIV